MSILNDRNYKKYAIRKPKNIRQIIEIDTWAKTKTLNRIKLKMIKILIITLILNFIFHF